MMSAAFGISAVGAKDTAVGIPSLEHASGQLGEHAEFTGKQGYCN